MANNGSSQTAFGLSVPNLDTVEGDIPAPGHPMTPVKDLHQHDIEVLADEEGLDAQDLADEDVHNLIGVSISRAATKFLSPQTPAAEKAAAMEDLDGGGMFSSDGDITPPLEPIRVQNPRQTSEAPVITKLTPVGELSLSFGKLPSTQPQVQRMPSPWVAEPQTFVIERPEASRSVLRDTFGTRKIRSFSGGAEALKRFLPSLPKAGNLIANIPSPPFFSSNDDQKSRSRGFSLYRDFAPSWPSMTNSGFGSPSFANNGKLPEQSIRSIEKKPLSESSSSTQLPALRRVASEDSVLYHTLSRASSLGDDTRFENHREMANSRIKAIRDSLQDRSSFRLPSMPSMLRVPSFNFVINSFGLNSGVTFTSWKSDADLVEDIMLGNAKKRLSVAPNPAFTPGMVGAAISRPEAAAESVQSVAEGSPENALDRALADLTGDIVIMGGYRGSILRSKKPPHRQLWVPVKVGLNIRKVNLEVGLSPEDEERMEEDIFASGMLQHIGPVDISRRLFKRLRESEKAKQGKLRIWDYGYDWRLSPHILSKKLIGFLDGLPSNQPGVADGQRGAIVIAHSLGGLITRHAVNCRPELFSGVVYAGVPKSCVNILGPLRNGDAVMLSSRVLTAQVNFTLRTSFALLPLDGYCFIDKNTKEEYPVDFFDIDDWIKYRWSPCIDPPLPSKSESPGGLANILKQGSSLTNLQLPGMRSSIMAPKKTVQAQTSSSPGPEVHRDRESSRYGSDSPSLADRGAGIIRQAEGSDRTLAPQMGNRSNPVKHGQGTNTSVSTAVTIPRDKAIAYLRRTLSETKQFKLELAHKSEYQQTNRYPPFAIIYGKSIPTVYGAKIDGRDGIACADAYDNLAFASGDGVCLSREAMLPEGYHVVKGGRINSDRGHVTLLGDLNAVGKALQAVMKGRAKRMGLGVLDERDKQHGAERM